MFELFLEVCFDTINIGLLSLFNLLCYSKWLQLDFCIIEISQGIYYLYKYYLNLVHA